MHTFVPMCTKAVYLDKENKFERMQDQSGTTEWMKKLRAHPQTDTHTVNSRKQDVSI